MNVMKKITILVALLLVSMAFVGAASAATAGYSDKTITPSTSLIPGQTVTAVFKMSLPAGSIGDTDTITFGSALVNANWEVKVFKGEADKNSQNPAVTRTGTSTPKSPYKADMFAIYNGNKQDVTLVVTLTGKVDQNAGGTSINVVNAQCSSSQVGSYLSPAQTVYKPGNVNADISRLNNDIAATEKRIAEYSALGVDVSSATQQIANAKNKASAAQSSSSNALTAYANIEAADAFITQAERTLSLTGLKAANTNMGAITTAQNTLYERGWNTEAQYLETKLTSMRYSYDSLAAVYNTGGNPDTAKMDQLVKDSYTVLEQANQYVEDSEGLPIGQFLPIIIGVIVAVAVVVGAVFFIRKRRNSRWDELG